MSRSHAAARSPSRRFNVAGSGGIPANGVRPTIRLEKAENVPHEEGHHVAGSGRDRTDFRHAGTFVTDAAAFRPVAAAYAACDVVPTRLTPDGVSDAERHRLADETIGVHECQHAINFTSRTRVFVANQRQDVDLWIIQYHQNPHADRRSFYFHTPAPDGS